MQNDLRTYTRIILTKKFNTQGIEQFADHSRIILSYYLVIPPLVNFL